MRQILALSLCLVVAVVHCSTQIKQVVEGHTVFFRCTLTENLPPGDIYWVQEWFGNKGLPRTKTMNARANGEMNTDRGVYTTTYRSRSGIGWIRHECTLRVDEAVTANDEETFKCIHKGWFRDRGTFYTGILRVIEQVAGSPDCLVRPVRNDADLLVGSSVELKCSLQNGDSDYRLSWFKNGDEFIESATANTFSVNRTLRDVDNGVNFVCKVTSTSDTDMTMTEAPQCLVTPFEKSPNVTLSTFQLHSSNGLFVNGSFMCCGTGIPRIDRYEWYVNGSLITEDEARYRISKKQTCSELFIYDITTDDNITQIQCEVSVPAGLSSSAISTIVLRDNLHHQYTTISSNTIQQTPSIWSINGEDQSYTVKGPQMIPKSFFNAAQQTNYVIPIGVGVASILVIIIIIIFVILVLRQRPNNKSTDPIVIENDYEMSGPTSSASQPTPKKSETNVEGLNYASLVLNQSIDDNRVLHPDADEAVVYADVRNL